ncbi:MAG: hypothetical protein FWB73_03105 [Treponema sp.]|nr:hypothetical protein [Treponema sp.]
MLKGMTSREVRSIAGGRGFFVKQTDVMILTCHGGIEEVDVALKHNIQTPQGINLIFCKNGIEIKAIASGKIIQTALANIDIVSIKFAGGIAPSGSTASVAAGAFVGGALFGGVGALAGAAMGAANAASGRICYGIEYKSATGNGTLLVSFLPAHKKKVDKLFEVYGSRFNPTMS